MKRDMNLVRYILMEIEKRTFEQEYSVIVVDGFGSEEIMYHIKLLSEAGLIHAQDMSGMSDIYFLPGSLTWEGHEFLELIRNETRWNKAKEIMTSKAGGFVFDVLKQLLITLVKEAVFQA